MTATTKTQLLLLRETERLTAMFNATYVNGVSEVPNAPAIDAALVALRVALATAR